MRVVLWRQNAVGSRHAESITFTLYRFHALSADRNAQTSFLPVSTRLEAFFKEAIRPIEHATIRQ